jgi:hypothetical protein
MEASRHPAKLIELTNAHMLTASAFQADLLWEQSLLTVPAPTMRCGYPFALSVVVINDRLEQRGVPSSTLSEES